MARLSNPNNIGYYAEKYFRTFSDTVSLNKNEVILSTKGMEEAVRVAYGAYLYYAKREKVNKIVHPYSFKEMKEYETNKDLDKKFNKYKVCETYIRNESNTSELDDVMKNDIREKINNALIENNVSLNKAAELTGVKQPHLYNFLKKGLNASLSLDKVLDAWEIIRQWENY